MSHNTILHRLVRPLVRPLASTVLRPNHVTGLRIATAIAAAAAFLAGTSESIWIGAGLFVLSALLDRADGELARMTRNFSSFGHRLDLIADCGTDALVFFAMGIGARHGWLGDWTILLGTLAAVGSSALFWQLNAPNRPRPSSQTDRMVDPDDLILIIPVIACSVGMVPVLILAGSITPLAAMVRMTAKSRRIPAAMD